MVNMQHINNFFCNWIVLDHSSKFSILNLLISIELVDYLLRIMQLSELLFDFPILLILLGTFKIVPLKLQQTNYVSKIIKHPGMVGTLLID